MFVTTVFPYYTLHGYSAPRNSSTRGASRYRSHPYLTASDLFQSLVQRDYEECRQQAFEAEVKRQHALRRQRRQVQRRRAARLAEERRIAQAQAQLQYYMALQDSPYDTERESESESEQAQEEVSTAEPIKLLQAVFGFSDGDTEMSDCESNTEQVDADEEAKDSPNVITITVESKKEDDESAASESETSETDDAPEPVVEEPTSEQTGVSAEASGSGETIELDPKEASEEDDHNAAAATSRDSSPSAAEKLSVLQEKINRSVETYNRLEQQLNNSDASEALSVESQIHVLHETQRTLEDLYQQLDDFEFNDASEKDADKSQLKRTKHRLLGLAVTYADKVDELVKRLEADQEKKEVKDEEANVSISPSPSPSKIRHVEIETIPDDSE